VKARPSLEKRRKERARQDKKREKAERRDQRKAEKGERPSADGDVDVDPDIAHIVPGPQPLPIEALGPDDIVNRDGTTRE
jgi:hypothetical protein